MPFKRRAHPWHVRTTLGTGSGRSMAEQAKVSAETRRGDKDVMGLREEWVETKTLARHVEGRLKGLNQVSGEPLSAACFEQF